MSRRPDRRAYIDRPFLDPHLERRRELAEPPRGFAGLLRWFLEGFWAETPERVHVSGVWFGRAPGGRDDIASYEPATGAVLSDVGELTGGSQLGAPRQAEPFRQLVENSARQTAGDGVDEHYVRPMRAALERLHCRTDGDAPFMARFLLQVAYAQGDWHSVADRWFVTTPWVGRAFAEKALERLYQHYRPDPPIRYAVDRPGWVSISESQRQAVVAGEKGVA